MKKSDEAKKWYLKAAKGGYSNSVNNLGVYYHKNGDSISAGAYFIALIAYGEPKNDILDFLKNDWKLDRATLQKAYELQKTLDIPKHYTGGID
jgi:TPR repeat protein